MRFSASRLKTYQTCGLQAKYKYEDKLPELQVNAKAVFGTVVHRALETYNSTGGNVDLAKKEFRHFWSRPTDLTEEPTFWPRMTTYEGLMKKGVEVLDQYHDTHRYQTGRTVLGTEVKFLVPFGDHELYGFVDLVEIDKSGTGKELLKVVDFKGAGKLPNLAELALDIQFSTYAYAVTQREFWCGIDGNAEFNGVPNGEWWWSMIQGMPVRCIWYALMHAKQIDAGPRTQTDFERLYRLCNEIERSLQAGIVVPRISGDCLWCAYQEPCALEIPVSIRALEDKTDRNRWI